MRRKVETRDSKVCSYEGCRKVLRSEYERCIHELGFHRRIVSESEGITLSIKHERGLNG